MSFAILQPDTTGTCCCQSPECAGCGGDLTIEAGACASQSAGLRIYGVTRFDWDGTQDLNTIKFLRRSHASSSPYWEVELYDDPDDCDEPDFVGDYIVNVGDVNVDFDPSDGSHTPERYQRDQCGSVDLVNMSTQIAWGTGGNSRFLPGATLPGPDSDGVTVISATEARYDRSYTPGSCGNIGSGISGRCGLSTSDQRKNTSTTTSTWWNYLSIPSVLSTGVILTGGEGGSSCTTTPPASEAIGNTHPGSDDSVVVGAHTLVTVPLTLGGVAPGNYTFIVDVEIYDLSDVYQNDEEIEVTIELEAGDITDGAAIYEYNVPVRVGEKVKFISVRDLAAA